MEKVIEIKNLCKSFGEVKAVNDLTFSVRKGELYAFLGVNGAGKSTTISVICGALEADSGEVIVNGCDAKRDYKKVKNEIGIVFQNSVLDGALSVYENLKIRASLYGILDQKFEEKYLEVSKYFNLDEIKNRTVSKLSGGQRRRADIARALISSPSLLILDEPTTGLDPQTRKSVWGTIEKLIKDKGMTVLLTTHYMEEANIADYITIIDSGKNVAGGTPNELKNEYAEDCLYLYTDREDVLDRENLKYDKIAEGYKIKVKNTKTAKEILDKIPEITDFEVIKGKMDDVFLNVTGKSLAGDKNENV